MITGRNRTARQVSYARPVTATAPESEAVSARPSGGSRARRLRFTGPVLRLGASAGAGAVLYLSFPPRPLWWLAPLAFAGLGLVLHGRRARAGFGYGLAFALVFNLAHLVWIQDFLGVDFGPAPWLTLSALMALFAALACAGMAVVSRVPGAPVWMACLYLGQEAVRSQWPINGFPWGRVAFSQPEGAFTSLAFLGGAPLVGFAILASGFGLAQLIVRVRRRAGLSGPVAAAVLPVLVGLAVWPTVGTAPTAGTVTVAVVQGNAPNAGLGLLGARDIIRQNHLAESERLLAAIREGRVDRPDIVIWPETATAVAGADPVLDRTVSAFGVPGLIGALYYLPDGGAENAVVAWDPESGRGQRYAKQELVPFAEYVPLRSIARWFTPFVEDTLDMRAGRGPGILDLGVAKVGVAICYEAAYDYVSRQAVAGGAELLVVPTNNAWYGPGEMSYQQLAMSRLRAVELGRSVVVAATSGVSAVARPDGSLVRSTGLYTAESVVEEVALRDTTTPARWLGPWPGRFLVGVGVLTLLLTVGFRFRSRAARADRAGGEDSYDRR